MIICKRCGKENQDHYKFCLGCGDDIGNARAEPAAPPPPPVAPSAPLAPAPQIESAPSALLTEEPSFAPLAAPLGSSPIAAPAPEAPCPACGTAVRAGYIFCGNCGHRIEASGAVQASPDGVVGRTVFMGGSGPAPGARPAPGKLTLIRSDGSEASSHPLVEGINLIGRGHGPLFDADMFLSPRHAELVLDGRGLQVRPLPSLNGVFLKIAKEEEIESGTIFRIGQELIRFDALAAPATAEDGTHIMGSPNPGFWGRLSLIVGIDKDGSAFPLYTDTVVLGRERGDILFPEDGYVSGTHSRVSRHEGRFFLTDLGSSNGTFLRIKKPLTVPSGSFLLMGQQLFKVQF